MTIEEFALELQRVADIFGGLSAPVVGELRRRWATAISLAKWHRLCTYVIEHSRFPPLPAAWTEAFEALSPGWRSEAHESRDAECAQCKSRDGFRLERVTIRESEYTVLVPCQACRPGLTSRARIE